MKRTCYNDLRSWKRSDSRKPLILKGARQVGKTFLIKEFGKNEYENFAYFNFDEEPQLNSLFKNDLRPHNLIKKLSLKCNKKIKEEETLIFFDEVQMCPEALNSLKYFAEEAPKYHLIAAGSLLGMFLSNERSFPVGKVNFLNLFPMTFFEFLEAMGKNELLKFIKEIKSCEPIEELFHNELCELLKLYYFIGGMPEAVQKYILTENFNDVRKVHKEILASYIMDFSKYSLGGEAIKILSVWNSMIKQLAKENRKFKYSLINENARLREYLYATIWLESCGLIHKVKNIEKPMLPFEKYVIENNFKAYLLDVGLLSSMAGLNERIIIDGNRFYNEFKGAFTENFIVGELTATYQEKLYCWTQEHKAEVEILLNINGKVLPLEVKAGKSRHKKSLMYFNEKYKPEILLRTSLRNLKKDGKVLNCPLYLISRIFELV